MPYDLKTLRNELEVAMHLQCQHSAGKGRWISELISCRHWCGLYKGRITCKESPAHLRRRSAAVDEPLVCSQGCLCLKLEHVYNSLSCLDSWLGSGLASCTPLPVPYLIVLREENYFTKSCFAGKLDVWVCSGSTS